MIASDILSLMGKITIAGKLAHMDVTTQCGSELVSEAEASLPVPASLPDAGYSPLE
jgi:hypothetical protein